MTFVLGKAGKKLFEKHLEQYAPADPMYDYYTDDNGKKHRRRKELPPGLSKRDAKILKSVKKRAHRLDKGFSLCGLKFGWTFIIGLIPGAGDIADASLNYFLVVRKAKQAELPPWLVRQMLANNAVSAIVGVIPVAGDVVLAIWKANSRNAALLEEFLRIRGEDLLKLEQGKHVSKADAVQVKPGTGIESGEAVPGTSKQVPYKTREKKDAHKATAVGETPAGTAKKSFWGGKTNAGSKDKQKGKFVEGVSTP